VGAAGVLGLGASLRGHFGIEPAIGDAFTMAAAIAGALVCLLRPRPRPGVTLAAGLGLIVAPPLAARALATAALALAGSSPEGSGRSLALRAIASGLAGAFTGALLGWLACALGSIRPSSGRPPEGSALAPLRPAWAVASLVAAGATLSALPALQWILDAHADSLLGLVALVAVALGVLCGRLARGRRIPPVPVFALGGACAAVLAPETFLESRLASIALVGVGLLGLGFDLARVVVRAPRAAAVGLIAAAILLPLEERAFLALAERSWSEATKARFALGRDVPRERIPSDLASGELVLRSFAVEPTGIVAVVDSKSGNARELRRNGMLLGSVAANAGDSRADVQTPVLAAILAGLGRRGERVAVLGLGDGIATGTLASAGASALFLVEPDAAIRALRDDPGDLFHGAWREPGATVVPEDPVAFLRRTTDELDAILDLESALPDAGALRAARARLKSGAALVRVLRGGPAFGREAKAFAAVFPEALVFHAPRGGDAAILVGGVAHLSSASLATLGHEGDPLGRRLALTGVAANQVLGTYVAGAVGLERASSLAALLPAPEDALALEQALGVASEGETLASRPSPRAQDALVRVADAAGKLGFLGVDRALLEAMRARRGDSAELARALGDLAFQEGRDEEAVRLWNEAISLDSRALTPRLSLAVRHLKRREFALARSVLKDALSGDRAHDAPVHFLLGQAAFDEQDYAQAKMHYKLASGFENADARAEVSEQLAQEKASLEGTHPQAPIEKDAARLLREARLVLDETERVERDLGRKGLVLTDEQAALLKSRREYAKTALEEAAKLAPQDAQIAFELGRARAVLGDREGARLAFENASALDPENGRPLLALGDLLRAAGQDDAALETYERGLARGPVSSASARAYLACADILFKKDKLEEAAHTLEEADRVAPGHPDVIVNLGFFYEKLGRKADAIRTYERWLDVTGDAADPAERRRVEKALGSLKGR
jgi:tetratricopeptide (TPR) repeat protein